MLSFKPLLSNSVDRIKSKFNEERENINEIIINSSIKESFRPKMQFEGDYSITEETYPQIIKSIFDKCVVFAFQEVKISRP